MTLLKISEQVRDHLIKQKAQSREDVAFNCQYRAADGNMCAVGCLIPDALYDPALENKGMRTEALIEVVSKALKLRLDADSVQALQYWQNYHDSYFIDWKGNDVGFKAGYGKWLEEGADPSAANSPEAMHEYMKTIERFDMSGEITKRYISQVSRYILHHLLEQNKQSKNTVTGNCRYRSDDGCMCAVGALIKDEHYSINLEGDNINSISVRKAVSDSLGVEAKHGSPLYSMLVDWQCYHDFGTPTFTLKELEAKHTYIMLKLDEKRRYPNLKD